MQSHCGHTLCPSSERVKVTRLVPVNSTERIRSQDHAIARDRRRSVEMEDLHSPSCAPATASSFPSGDISKGAGAVVQFGFSRAATVDMGSKNAAKLREEKASQASPQS